MIIYNSTKQKFLEDCDTNQIENIILNLLERHGKTVGKSEFRSWKNSLGEMDKLLYKTNLPDNAGISIEYTIPQTSKRIDFIITGRDKEGNDIMIIIELKQWESATITNQDGLVNTVLGGGMRDTNHPSYQVWSYATLMEDYNATVEELDIKLIPCAYLHNYRNDDVIRNEFYEEYISKAPVFLKDDKQKLRDFIDTNIVSGDEKNLITLIDNGKIRPSKSLADRMSSMIQGNQEFVMIDDQKIVYEKALLLAKQSNKKNKNVLIVEGGPGTGKSVIAINLLVKLTNDEYLAQYVTKNSAPRQVYHSKLTRKLKKTTIFEMFKSSGSYTQTEVNSIDALIVDEAHRLNEKSGVFSNLGENQIKEIIKSSKFSIFFIDEDQKVTFKDIGDIDEIIKQAKSEGANIHRLELSSQFRCDGSDGYMAWLDNVLQIRETANEVLDISYDFKVFDNPNELRNVIIEKNKINNKARIVAGYCWNWISKKNINANDIVFPGYNFGMKWNLTKDGMLWIISPKSVNEVGCIHTCQGLEVDYVGVIIGNDLIIRGGELLVNPYKRAKTDTSLNGYKKLLKIDEEGTKKKAKEIIKNTYRTLMSRGMKGCYIYCTDRETRDYFKQKLEVVNP